MNKPDYLISTPENVDLHLELAGLGNRIIAGLVDRSLIGGVSLLVIVFCIGGAVVVDNATMANNSKTLIYYYLVGIGILLVFSINFGYFIFFEGMWQGQTPGKRVVQIRVIEANGQPVGWSSVFIRNLLRIVDELPGIYPGIIPMMIDKNERRFGDLAAGTLVIRERLQSISTGNLQIVADTTVEPLVDTGQIDPGEYGLLVNFLKRREILTASTRKQLATEMADYFREKLEMINEADSAEVFIEKLYIAYDKRADLSAD